MFDGSNNAVELLEKITDPDLDDATVMNTYVKWSLTYDEVSYMLF